jgi:hypothetical protein
LILVIYAKTASLQVLGQGCAHMRLRPHLLLYHLTLLWWLLHLTPLLWWLLHLTQMLPSLSWNPDKRSFCNTIINSLLVVAFRPGIIAIGFPIFYFITNSLPILRNYSNRFSDFLFHYDTQFPIRTQKLRRLLRCEQFTTESLLNFQFESKSLESLLRCEQFTTKSLLKTWPLEPLYNNQLFFPYLRQEHAY